MQVYPKDKGSVKSACFLNFFIGIVLFIVSSISFASPVIIAGNKIITTPTTYNNVVLDMSNGRFTVNTGGSLHIENSTINITISPSNPYFGLLNNGNLTLKNNIVNVHISGITPNSAIKAAYQFIQVQLGNVNIDKNTFTADTFFTLCFLETTTTNTNGFTITNNTIKNFHGGLYLVNSNNASVNDNIFENVSFTNILTMGNLSKFKRNLFSFPGNLILGDAFHVINSNGLIISDNVIASGSGYGIYIMGGQNLFIENNKITDGSSYAIFIDTPSLATISKYKHAAQLFSKRTMKTIANSNIAISNNYIAQNRYGLTGGTVDNLIVTNNIFIQRFVDSSTRQHWTNNDILLPLATNVTWLDNLYKEAFTQEVPGDNSNSLQFVSFPQHGGVFLP